MKIKLFLFFKTCVNFSIFSKKNKLFSFNIMRYFMNLVERDIFVDNMLKANKVGLFILNINGLKF